MDTGHGRFGGDAAAAALANKWMNEGDFGDYDFANEGDGSGSALFLIGWANNQRNNRPNGLTFDEARYLADEQDMTWEELTELDKAFGNAGALGLDWDSQGFYTGTLFTDEGEIADAIAMIEASNRNSRTEEEMI